MKKYTLNYPLAEGFVDHWLATPILPEALETRATGAETEIEFRQRCLRAHEADPLPFTEYPRDVMPIGNEFWGVVHCKGDHLLEKTAAAPVWQRLVRWAYVEFNAPATQSYLFQLGTSGAITLWANDAKMFQMQELQPLDHQGIYYYNLSLHLKRGKAHLFLRMEDVAQGDALISASLRLLDDKMANVQVMLPTENEETELRKKIESLYDQGYLARQVTTFDDQVTLHFTDRTAESSRGILRIQEPSGGIRGETFCDQEPGTPVTSVAGYSMPAGPMEAVLMPLHEAYYHLKFQPQRIIPFLNVPYQFSSEPQGEYDDRLVAVVREMARKEGIFAELAKMVLGWWDMVSQAEIEKAIERVNQRAAGCLLDLLGLISMASHMEKYKNFPAEIAPKLEAAITAFPYNLDKALRPLTGDETDRLLLATCQVLSGQKYPRVHFKVSSRTGAKERKQGETTVLALLRQSGQIGWREGYSRLDERFAALSTLADLADDETTGELAAVSLDNLGFALAQYSFKGVFGVPQLQAVPSQLKTARLSPVSAINQLLFGTGNNNENLVGAFCLSIAKTYEMPDLIRLIAAEQPEGAWTTEHSARPEQGWQADQATFKTTDYLLSSLQDYQPGAWGGRVNPWQATFGPEAVVFTSHPTSLDYSDHRQAGAWGGSGSLPRIAQWNDALICLYQLPEDDALGFTHAYFPTFAFDEYRLEGDWAFARKGDGYLAISASTGLTLVSQGDDANCELRSTGQKTAWLVQMGRRAQDGEFDEFCQAVLAHPAKFFDGLYVEWPALRGTRMELGWSGPFRRNRVDHEISFAKRFEGPFVDAVFPAEIVNIAHGEQLMRLSFS
jgi:hypothetical protein